MMTRNWVELKLILPSTYTMSRCNALHDVIRTFLTFNDRL